MKKKYLAALSLMLPVLFLAGCGGTTAVQFTPNWYKNTSSDNIGTRSEELEYSVHFVANATSSPLGVSYTSGVYKTKLSAATRNGTSVYLFETELNMEGYYTFNEEKGPTFRDKMTSCVYFYGQQDGFKPIESNKFMHCTSPNLNYTGIADAYTTYEYSYTFNYENQAKPTLTYTRSEPKDANGENYTLEKKLSLGDITNYYDNEQLLFLLRGLDMTEAVTLKTVNPLTWQTVNVKMNEKPKVSQETKFQNQLRINGETVTTAIEACTFSVGYTSSPSGSPQTLTYAKKTDNRNNTYHNVLLMMDVPISLGTLKYTLTSATFVD